MTEMTGDTRAWLESVALPGTEIVRTILLPGGYRNDNLLLECADGGRFVLRRYLRDRRGEVESALARKITGVVPVAEVVAIRPESEALLLAFVPGSPVDVLLPALTEDEAVAVGEAAGRALAALGSIRFDRDGSFTDATLRPEPMRGAVDLAGFVEDCLRRLDPGWELPRSDHDGLRALARAWTPLVAKVAGCARLVHGDFNPKNLLAARVDDGWRITVLDWEFAFSGCPLTDLGNLLRFGETDFTDGLIAGYGPLPAGWRQTARALDLFSVAEFLTRAPQQPIAADIRALVGRLGQPS